MTSTLSTTKNHLVILPPTTKPTIVSLTHPRTKNLARFVVDSSDPKHTKVFEITQINGSNAHFEGTPDPRSIILQVEGDKGSVIQDPSVFMTTPFSPLWLILPTLVRHKDKLMTLDDLHEASCHGIDRMDLITEETFDKYIPDVCEVMDEGEKFYKLSDEKLLAHLKTIVTSIKDSLPNDIYVRHVQNLLDSDASAEIKDLAKEHIAMNMLGSNLPPDVTETLLKSVDFEPYYKHKTQYKAKRDAELAAQAPSGPPEKKRKKSAPAKEEKAPAKNKRLTAFFSVVPKKDK
ncbi:hypothetical protein CJU90_6316 [Yarrowia sp. C11]|nr:hypothetical protein CJU90_6316 [Yarrowia sp. C11]KAG5371021.1 hypothetical protein CKK34_1157 [Yarrowia sp. E02]